MINVLYTEKGLGKGGSALSLKYLLDALDRSQYHPTLVFNHEHADVHGLEWGKVEILKSPDAESLLGVVRNAFKLARIIKEKKINIVHLNNDIDSHLAGILASKITGTPFVCHLRTTRSFTRKEKIASKWIEHFIVLSETGRDFFIKQGIPEKKITVSYDPFDVSVSNIETGRPIGNGFSVGICSRLARGKGHEVLIEAAKLVTEVFPSVQFFIAGDEANDSPGLKKELEAQVSHLGLIGKIHFLGWQTDVASFLNKVDILVDPSYLPEGLRRTIVEAMLASKPIIATNVGQTKEIIENSGAGVLVLCHDSQGLAEAMLELLKDGVRIKVMGEQGRKYAVEKFDMYKKAKEIELLYDSVLLNHER